MNTKINIINTNEDIYEHIKTYIVLSFEINIGVSNTIWGKELSYGSHEGCPLKSMTYSGGSLPPNASILYYTAVSEKDKERSVLINIDRQEWKGKYKNWVLKKLKYNFNEV